MPPPAGDRARYNQILAQSRLQLGAPAYDAAQNKPGSWLLDPFGFSPRLVLEAARAGYRVLVTVNHPTTRFLLERASVKPRIAVILGCVLAVATLAVGVYGLVRGPEATGPTSAPRPPGEGFTGCATREPPGRPIDTSVMPPPLPLWW